MEPVCEQFQPIVDDGMRIRCVVTWKTEEGRYTPVVFVPEPDQPGQPAESLPAPLSRLLAAMARPGPD